MAPANLAAQILLRASQKAAPHVLLSRARCDTNQPHAPAQLHCCTTAMPRCSSSGSLGLCLHACHTPCSPIPSLAAGKQALPVFRSQHGGPSFASSILWHIGDRETELQPRWEWWVPALSVLLRACWGWENCSQVPFPPRGWGCVSSTLHLSAQPRLQGFPHGEVLQDPMRSLVYRSWTSLPQLCAIWSLQ